MGLRLKWLMSEGTVVEPGEEIARYDTTALERWLNSNTEDLEVLERRADADSVGH